jgi:hypothetical protein
MACCSTAILWVCLYCCTLLCSNISTPIPAIFACIRVNRVERSCFAKARTLKCKLNILGLLGQFLLLIYQPVGLHQFLPNPVIGGMGLVALTQVSTA